MAVIPGKPPGVIGKDVAELLGRLVVAGGDVCGAGFPPLDAVKPEL